MYKGHRIRAGDQHLVYHVVLGWLIALFIGWMGIFIFNSLDNLRFLSYHFPLLKLFGL